MTTIISTNTSLITTSRISTSQISTDINTTDLTKNSDITTIQKFTSPITTTDIKTSETESTNSQITTDNFKSTNLNSSTISTELLTSLKTESVFNYWKFIIFDIMNPTPTFTIFMSLLASHSTSLHGCLVNCSNHGQCKLNMNSFIYECGCDPYFSGSFCQYDSSPCSPNPCLNNGTCTTTNSKNGISFQCECQSSFYGGHCENQINICENKTCNQHGYCYNSLNVPKCKCLIGYSGDDCETASIFTKIVRPSVQILATVICILVIIATIFFVVSNDLLNYYYTIKRKNKPREPLADKKFWVVKFK